MIVHLQGKWSISGGDSFEEKVFCFHQRVRLHYGCHPLGWNLKEMLKATYWNPPGDRCVGVSHRVQ